MAALIYIIVMIVAMIIAYAMAPRPKGQTPPSLTDFNVPTAQDGREVVDCCGTVWIDDPNVIWFGDLRVYPIRQKVG